MASTAIRNLAIKKKKSAENWTQVTRTVHIHATNWATSVLKEAFLSLDLQSKSEESGK
jgi:hypothetical protein